MRPINFNTRAFQTYVPIQVLRTVCGEHSSALLLRMKRHHLGIGALASLTGLNPLRIKETVLGQKPPISTRGSWTKEAIQIARTLRTDPETIFGRQFERIGSALVHPDASMLPEELAGEIHRNLTAQ